MVTPLDPHSHRDNGAWNFGMDFDNDEGGTEFTLGILADEDPEMPDYHVSIDTNSECRFRVTLNDAKLYDGNPEVELTPVTRLAEAVEALIREPDFNAVQRGAIRQVLDKHAPFLYPESHQGKPS